MAVYTADHEGKVHITAGRLSFAITGMDGITFTPGSVVFISDERIASLIAQLGAPFGIEGDDEPGLDAHSQS